VRNSKSVHIISLGCPKNRVDTERILSALFDRGYTHADDPFTARFIIINTCAFIEAAVEESIDAILDIKTEHPDAFVVVAGCLPLRYREDLIHSLPEIDLFLTPDRIHELPDLIAADTTTTPDETINGAYLPGRVLTTPGYAYLKIAEGCSRKCTYCTIPSIRGPLTSYDPEMLAQEAASFASCNVRELVLVAQDLTAYGVDRNEKHSLTDLLKRLEMIENLSWIRLMYLHPDGIPRSLPELLKNSEKILPYMDIPFQHVSDHVLKSMGRPWKGNRIRKLVDNLRNAIPGLVLRTTFMVGFPTERDEDFQELRDFVEEFRIEHVGVFAYSPEEGTPAFKLGDPIPDAVKNARSDQIRAIHTRFMKHRLKEKIGTTQESIIEGVSSETDLLLQGRTWDQAPEVDGVLYITSGNSIAGEIRKVKITATHETDLFGEIIQ
jgi:ribosomal protein S12 methylthiotransferase